GGDAGYQKSRRPQRKEGRCDVLRRHFILLGADGPGSLGLEIGRDVTIVQVGGGTARILAMETRAISAAPLTPPDTEIVKERFGAWPIVSNESQIFSSLPTASGLTTSEVILQSKPELVKKMVQATMT